MFIRPPNLSHSFHTVCKIISFKVEKKFFTMCSRGIAKFWGPRKSVFRVGMD
jgi:hypothetical protein